MSERHRSEGTPPTPRWEQESTESRGTPDGNPPIPAARWEQSVDLDPQPTTELELPFGDDDDDGAWPEREPRLAAARESLSATRESFAESLAATRESLSTTASKVGRWLHSLDRRPEFHAGRDPLAELAPAADREPEPVRADSAASTASPARSRSERKAAGREADDREPGDRDDEDRDGIEIGVRFPTAPLGYNRQAVDSHIALLEEEITELREQAAPPLSIEEEIERLGEQTASILVVAHDKAHETARRAQQQAARAVREAAADAERITAAAEQRLRELDEETDAVWRERELEDVREVSRTLATLADAASERFPAAPDPMAPVAAAGAQE